MDKTLYRESNQVNACSLSINAHYLLSVVNAVFSDF